MSRVELPAGWRLTPLGSVWESAQAGFASSARSDNGILQLRLNNVTRYGEFDWSTSLRVPADHGRRDYSLRPGDLVFNNTNSIELVGKSAVVEQLPEPTVYSNHFTRLRFKSEVCPNYVGYWLRSLWHRKVFEHGCDRWVGQAAFQKTKLAELMLPLAPLSEQRRIADKLDEAQRGITVARSALTQQQEELARAHAAAVEFALGGRVIAAESDPIATVADWVPLADVARLESGHTPSRKRSEWWNGDVPWIALPDIRALDGRTAISTGEQTNALGLANSSARLLPVGTVVLSRTASVGFVTVMGVPMATSQDFVNWAPSDRLRSWYLAHALIAARDYVRGLSEGAIHKTIYMPTLAGLRIRLPSLADQDRALARIAELGAAREQAAAAFERQAAALDALGPALLHTAFQGQF